jgi:hypothetical protein
MNATQLVLRRKPRPPMLPPAFRNGNGGCGGKLPLPRRPLQVRQAYEVAKQTGPLAPLADQKVVVIADAQNLDAGAKELGVKMSWANLGHVLDGCCLRASRHAILAQREGDDRRMAYLTERGWTPHATLVRQVTTHKGVVRKGAHADFLMAFLAGVIVSRTRATVCVIASGDGDLVEEMALGIRSLPRARRIVTLSLAGSTAFRLNAETSPLIDANIEIGRDCLRDFGAVNGKMGQ